jgi:hypothetical protein
MPVITTVQRLREYMNSVSFSGGQEQVASRTLDGLERSLRTYLRTSLIPEERADRLWVDSAGYALARNRPIAAVTAVTLVPEGTADVNGTPLDGPFTVNGNSIYVGYQNANAYVVATYTAGPDHSERDDMALAIYMVAARIMAPRHDEGRTIRGLEATPNAEQSNPTRAPMSWTPEELAQFDNDRRPVGL